MIFYAGAALPPSLWARLEKLGIEETGQRVRMTSAWGSTETAPLATAVHYDIDQAGVIGNPAPGTSLRLLLIGESEGKTKYEIRVKGPNVTPGYWKRDDLTREAFDDEGFYKIGDAVRFADEHDHAKGIEFAGRVTEEFKLSSGTWVHTGALRVKAITALAPLVQDMVLTGHDRDTIRDFDARGADHDTLDLRDLRSITSFRDLVAHHMHQSGDTTVITTGAGDVIRLLHVNMADLGSTDVLI